VGRLASEAHTQGQPATGGWAGAFLSGLGHRASGSVAV